MTLGSKDIGIRKSQFWGKHSMSLCSCVLLYARAGTLVTFYERVL